MLPTEGNPGLRFRAQAFPEAEEVVHERLVESPAVKTAGRGKHAEGVREARGPGAQMILI